MPPVTRRIYLEGLYIFPHSGLSLNRARKLWREMDVTSRYFFDLVSKSDSAPDLEGAKAVDVSTAVAQAYEAIEELLREEPFANAHWRGWHIRIVDGSGQEIHRIPLGRYRRKKNQQPLEAGMKL